MRRDYGQRIADHRNQEENCDQPLEHMSHAVLSSSVPGPDEFDRPPDDFTRAAVVIEDVERVTTGGVIAEFKRHIARYRLLRETAGGV
jgi:hypothetical protein